MSFDRHLLFDRTASDDVLREQIRAFVKEGHTGSEFITLILYTHKSGLASHVSRLLSLFPKEGMHE